MLTKFLNLLIDRQSLKPEEVNEMIQIMLQSKQPEQMAAILALMRAKGETADELSTIVTTLRQFQVPIDVSMPVCDIVGTGGDGGGTANISTMASVLAAACGVTILKHGNRAVSSRCGSADVLEALGMNIDQGPGAVTASLEKYGLGFCYAPRYNPVFQTLKSIRQQLKIPTLFNLIGPLLNPGQAQTVLLGVGDPALMNTMTDCLFNLGIERAMIVHGQGLDELNTIGPCDVIELMQGKRITYTLDPLTMGFPRCHLEDLAGGDASQNASLFQRVLNGERSHLANTVILNAASVLYIAGRTVSIAHGVTKVQDVIASGKAGKLMKELCHA